MDVNTCTFECKSNNLNKYDRLTQILINTVYRGCNKSIKVLANYVVIVRSGDDYIHSLFKTITFYMYFGFIIQKLY